MRAHRNVVSRPRVVEAVARRSAACRGENDEDQKSASIRSAANVRTVHERLLSVPSDTSCAAGEVTNLARLDKHSSRADASQQRRNTLSAPFWSELQSRPVSQNSNTFDYVLVVAIAALFSVGVMSSARVWGGEPGEKAAGEHEEGNASAVPREGTAKEGAGPHGSPATGNHEAPSAEPPAKAADTHKSPKPPDEPASEPEHR